MVVPKRLKSKKIGRLYFARLRYAIFLAFSIWEKAKILRIQIQLGQQMKNVHLLFSLMAIHIIRWQFTFMNYSLFKHQIKIKLTTHISLNQRLTHKNVHRHYIFKRKSICTSLHLSLQILGSLCHSIALTSYQFNIFNLYNGHVIIVAALKRHEKIE